MSADRLRVNGEALPLDADDRTSLADFLREKADARSVHLGCEHGVCGACTVLVDGKIARSCIALAHAMAGSEITTLEGLKDDPTITQLRESFHECHGLQCGYCTPGVLITARDILHRYETLDESLVREALAGNLCRCTGYAGIVNAILDAKEKLNK